MAEFKIQLMKNLSVFQLNIDLIRIFVVFIEHKKLLYKFLWDAA